jgi:toxin ParE1/3/4
MTIRWTPAAARDLEDVHDYIAADNEDAAVATIARILAGTEALCRHPELGRRSRVRGTRELVVTPYVVAYRIVKEAVEVHAIMHGARQWPDRF